MRLKESHLLVMLTIMLLVTSSLSISTGTGHGSFQHSLEPILKPEESSFKLPSPGNQVVIPHFSYLTEPAPMGIADYGLGQPTSLGYYSYNYSTTKFLGIVNVSSLDTYNSSQSVTSNLSIQLNLNLAFYNNNTLFVYWIQDVAFLNSRNGSVQFIDNIWNFSSTSSSMLNSTVSGNGTIAKSGHTLFYYDLANVSLPGNNVTLKAPYAIKLQAISSVQNGIPLILFEYDDGYGWVTYDRVLFKFARNVDPDGNFLVDGSVTNPIGTNYDAELILGGPGNGSSTQDISSSVDMSLEYWNGHNFQEVPNAFNFGSDTAETIGNVVSQAYYDNATGTIYTNLTSGPGSLAEIYTSSDISTIDLKTGLSSGNLSVGGFNYSFVNNWVNVTIGPGNYTLKLYDYNGLLIWSRNISLKAGEVLPLIAKALYNVTFLVNGLPYGSTWRLNISNVGSLGPFGNSTLSIQLPNGTYNYSVYTTNKNYRAPPAAVFLVNGSSETVYLNFTLVTFQVRFAEAGLPPGTQWSVNIKGKYFNSSENTIVFYEPNGSYLFYIANASGYSPNVTNGPLIISGKDVSINVSFYYYVYLVGNISPKSATLYIDGKAVTTHSGHFNISLKAGSYRLKVVSLGYSTYSSNLTLNNTSKVQMVDINLQKTNFDQYYLLGALILVLVILVAIIAARRRR
ncbi:MAG: thermopsin family protease [Thermoplasmatales archaeon]